MRRYFFKKVAKEIFLFLHFKKIYYSPINYLYYERLFMFCMIVLAGRIQTKHTRC
jgi:hypothetical protein